MAVSHVTCHMWGVTLRSEGVATSPVCYLLLVSSESLMSLREHRLLFRVLPVPPPVRVRELLDLVLPLREDADAPCWFLRRSLGYLLSLGREAGPLAFAKVPLVHVAVLVFEILEPLRVDLLQLADLRPLVFVALHLCDRRAAPHLRGVGGEGLRAAGRPGLDRTGSARSRLDLAQPGLRRLAPLVFLVPALLLHVRVHVVRLLA
ncbi:hypothetical protein EYF80_028256 [Liparis tanakae]|uniref:Uncharacterized protein n=1 Tax=Liparis tanakae TaxID=230148 RepID=A0A4Z2H7A6_9TELE|nr:hypothetical protein EYF80_028256 [Liparis tanakae]